MAGVVHVHIDLRHTADQKVELSFVKNADEVPWNKFTETGQERPKLFIGTSVNAVSRDCVHVILLVLFRHWDVRSSRFHFNGDNSPSCCSVVVNVSSMMSVISLSLQ